MLELENVGYLYSVSDAYHIAMVGKKSAQHYLRAFIKINNYHK